MHNQIARSMLPRAVASCASEASAATMVAGINVRNIGQSQGSKLAWCNLGRVDLPRSSLDNVGGNREHYLGSFEPKDLCCLKIDGQLELC
jgi:hypothetical protein